MFYKIQRVILCWFLLGTVGSEILAQVDPQTTPIDPVSYTIKAPETIKSGDQFTISVVFNIQPGWFVYAPIAMNTARGKIPTKVTYKVPEGIKKINGLELPDKNGFLDTYKGNNVKMLQKFKVGKSTPLGKYVIEANIQYQTCTVEICYPPIRKKIDIEITVE